MKKFFTYTLLLSAFILSSCSEKKAPVQYSAYINQDMNVEFKYPSLWEKADIDESIIFFQAPKYKDSVSFAILIDQENTKLLDKTQKEFFDENKDNIRDFKIISFTKANFAGEEGIIAVLDSAGEYDKMRQKQYIFNHQGKLFMLIFTSLQKFYADYETVFNAVADSFTFTD